MELISSSFIGLLSSQISDHLGEQVVVHGMVYKVQVLSKAVFIQLLDASSIIQCVMTPETYRSLPQGSVKTGDWVRIEGRVGKEPRARTGFEIEVETLFVLQGVDRTGDHEVVANVVRSNDYKSKLHEGALTLRNLKRRSILKVKGVLEAGFTDFFISHDFTQINSPKIIFNGLQGGSNLFSVDYFGRKGYLSQSPQLYKQMMVGVFQRVFEIGPVFRANKNRGSRQLNEFIALDVEFGPLQSFAEISSLCMSALKHAFGYVRKRCEFEIGILGAEIPEIVDTPLMTYAEAEAMIDVNKTLLDQENKVMLCRMVKQRHGSEFLLLSNPRFEDCNFYFMEDELNPGFGKCWHLLFRGLDIGGGGQRLDDYNEQQMRMKALAMNIDDFQHYLIAHRYGLPPHGGFSISIERLVMKLLNLSNIKDVSLCPRDPDSMI